MDNRILKRHKTDSYCVIECAVANIVKIKNLGIGGICLRLATSRYINSGEVYDMKIVTKRKEELLLKAEVVWSHLTGTEKVEEDVYPIYDIGLRFIEQNDNIINYLKKLIGQLSY